MPPGRGFYPEGLTAKQIEQYVQAQPDKRDEIYSSTTVVRWNGDRLEGVPYHLAYRHSWSRPPVIYVKPLP